MAAPLHARRVACFGTLFFLAACGGSGAATTPGTQAGPVRGVAITGDAGIAMKPFISRDGSTLSFDESNDPGNDTDIFDTTRVDDTTSAFAGRVAGLATPALEGTPTMNRDERFSALSADHLTRWFTRIASGSSAPRIWRARRAGASSALEAPVRIEGLGDFAEAPGLGAGESRLYFHREEGVGYRTFTVPTPAP